MNEIIHLNNHKLLCGDATNKEDVEKLIGNSSIGLLLTDPPYGINIVNSNNTIGGAKPPTFGNSSNIKIQPNQYKPVLNDDKPFNPQHLLDLKVPSIIFGANNFAHELPNNSKWLVWYKKPSLNSKKNCFSDCELAWTNIKGKTVISYHHTWYGMIRKGERRLELKERVHPTQKPVGLLMKIIEDYTEPDDIVLDLYGGSGSTLIACEETGRKCLMMELSEDYIDVIKERYSNYMKTKTDKNQTTLI